MDKGAAFQEIKRSVDSILADKAWQRDSQRAPDAETRGVLSKQERKAAEAAREVTRALQAAERELMQAAAFLPDLPRKAFKEDALPRLERLRERLESMSQ